MRFVGGAFVIGVLFLSMTSCKDKEKVALSNKQRREIEMLRSEIELLDKPLKDRVLYDNLPLKLDDAESALDQEKFEVSGLEALLEEAKREREETEQDLENYKKKYSVGS